MVGQAGGNTDASGGADIGGMNPDSVPARAKPTAQAGAPLRHAPLRPDSYRPGAGWGEGPSGSPWADAEPEWESWPFPDEEPAEDEPGGPVFVDRSGRRRRMAVLIGSSVAVVIVVALVMLVAGLSGVAPLSVPGFPDLAKPAPPPTVVTTDNPVEPAPGAPGQAGTAANGTSDPPASVDRTTQRRVPTQTPPHPTKTK